MRSIAAMTDPPPFDDRVQNLGLHEVDRALSANYGRLSKSQRQVIDHLLRDARYAAVTPGTDIAKALGVSESTVTRAAQALGFAGYPDLQMRLRAQFATRTPERIASVVTELGDDPAAAAARVMLEDAANVRQTAEDLVPEDVTTAIDALVAAHSVYVFGARGSFGVALILGVGLQLLLPDARILHQTAGNLPDQLLSMSADDALVAVSLRRVDRVTVSVLKHAHRLGAAAIIITDHRSSTVTRMADLSLVVRPAPLRLTPSYAAAASLVNALITAMSLRLRDHAHSRLQLAEQLWHDFATIEDTIG
jgi:DNA-binding MurR/RpiR family transcriptional regulator